MAKDEEKIDISYETLWKFIIRPPRDIYDESELGDCVFSYRNRIYIRKDFNLLSSQGYLMKCSFIEPDEEERPSKIMPVVIYLHCNSSCRIEGINMATYLLRNDINLFVFDFPGSGLSEGEFISLGYHEKDDVKIVVDYVERLPGVGRIGLWGRSMGAATTMLYAHTDPRISCVVMDSPFADFYELSKELTLQKVKIPNLILDVALSIIRGTIKKKNGMDITKLKPIEACDKPNPPALFIHALEDEMVPIEHSLRLNQRYNGEKSLVSCKGGHNSARPKMVLERIQKFLCKYLKLEEKKIDEKPKILNDKEILIDPIPSKEPEEDEEIEDSEEEYEE
ncbi:MAG: alpha/beta hydrolase, partial [archaeon]|nr:alpha/beta hydrolase [archaeon]